MAYADLRQFLERLDREGELSRVETEVELDYEIGRICRKALDPKAPALLFNHIRGHSVPRNESIFNQKKYALALETTEDEVHDAWIKVLNPICYSLNNNVYEILIMIIFGVFGYLTRKFGFEGAPLLLAMVLGPLLEIPFRQSLLYGDQLIFFKRPISTVLLIATLLLLIAPLFPKLLTKKKLLD